MIKVIQGDLLKSDCNIIIHQANCFATMGAGIAKQIKRKYPEAYEVDRSFEVIPCSLKRLGNYSHTSFENNVVVFNLYGQYKYGRGEHTNYIAFRKGLKSITSNIAKNRPVGAKIGMPYGIGCGLAGGNWNEIYKIIEEISEEQNIEFYLYKL